MKGGLWARVLRVVLGMVGVHWMLSGVGFLMASVVLFVVQRNPSLRESGFYLAGTPGLVLAALTVVMGITSVVCGLGFLIVAVKRSSVAPRWLSVIWGGLWVAVVAGGAWVLIPLWAVSHEADAGEGANGAMPVDWSVAIGAAIVAAAFAGLLVAAWLLRLLVRTVARMPATSPAGGDGCPEGDARMRRGCGACLLSVLLGALVVFCALLYLFTGEQDACLDGGGRWNAELGRCEYAWDAAHGFYALGVDIVPLDGGNCLAVLEADKSILPASEPEWPNIVGLGSDKAHETTPRLTLFGYPTFTVRQRIELDAAGYDRLYRAGDGVVAANSLTGAGQAFRWDAAAGELRSDGRIPGSAHGAAARGGVAAAGFTSGTQVLVEDAGDAGLTVVCRSFPSGEELWRSELPGAVRCHAAAVSSSGTVALSLAVREMAAPSTGTQQAELVLLRGSDGSPAGKRETPAAMVRLDFSPRGGWLVATDTAGGIAVYAGDDLSRPAEEFFVESPHLARVRFTDDETEMVHFGGWEVRWHQTRPFRMVAARQCSPSTCFALAGNGTDVAAVGAHYSAIHVYRKPEGTPTR